MKNFGLKTLLLKKEKGQALLIVVVISTLTLMILMGVASRILGGQVNIRRSGEYDRSIASSENILNELIALIDNPSNQSCLSGISQIEHSKFNCAALNNLLLTNNASIFAKSGANKLIDISNTQGINLLVNTDPNASSATTGVWITCQNKTGKVMITRIYYDNATNVYKNDKGIFLCTNSPAVGAAPNSLSGNVVMFDPLGVKVDGVIRNKTMLIRARLLDDAPGNNPGQISIEAIGDTNSDSLPDVVAETGQYDFVIIGLGGLGSDSAIKFSKQKGDFSLPPGFDFVYFGED